MEAVGMSSVDHPDHYRRDTGHEAIDVIEAWSLGFCLGNTVKYIARAGRKGDALEDLLKARWYLDRAIADEKGKEPEEEPMPMEAERYQVQAGGRRGALTVSARGRKVCLYLSADCMALLLPADARAMAEAVETLAVWSEAGVYVTPALEDGVYIGIEDEEVYMTGIQANDFAKAVRGFAGDAERSR